MILRSKHNVNNNQKQYPPLSNAKFAALKKKLPFQYARLISAKLPGVSNRQVQMVFNGQITDPEKVEKILLAARELAAQLKKNNQLATKRIQPAKRSVSKPTV